MIDEDLDLIEGDKVKWLNPSNDVLDSREWYIVSLNKTSAVIYNAKFRDIIEVGLNELQKVE